MVKREMKGKKTEEKENKKLKRNARRGGRHEKENRIRWREKEEI
jgi:hypothetical protein